LLTRPDDVENIRFGGALPKQSDQHGQRKGEQSDLPEVAALCQPGKSEWFDQVYDHGQNEQSGYYFCHYTSGALRD
jgi:hypothetical protein